MLRREWRQQVLIVALVAVAVASTVVGSAAAIDGQAPSHAGFGTARNAATLTTSGAALTSQVATISRTVGPVDVIANRQAQVPGSIATFDWRHQDPHGAYGAPMLALLSGRYPLRRGEVALSGALSGALHLGRGETWHENGESLRIVGIVTNPQSLLEAFALVAPAQRFEPDTTTVLFNASPRAVRTLEAAGIPVADAGHDVNSGSFPAIILVATVATLGMILIGLVAVAGFTVLAQRRLRAIGMLQALGGTDRDVRRVVVSNGLATGVAGAALGLALGILGWLAYRPHLEQSSHHDIGTLALPWRMVALAVVLGVVTCTLAAWRPARSISKVPIVRALSGRPPAPKPLHRSTIVAVALGVAAFVLLVLAGAAHQGAGVKFVALGIVLLVVAVVFAAPMFLALASRAGRRLPPPARIALRDLSRFRSRSGSALGAISVGLLIAVLVCVVTAVRFHDVLDYVGPNLSPNELLVYANTPPPPGATCVSPEGKCPKQTYYPLGHQAAVASSIARLLGAPAPLELSTTSATLTSSVPGDNNFSGGLFVATPQLLAQYHIDPSAVPASAEVLSMRPGLDTTGNLRLVWGRYFEQSGPGVPTRADPCPSTSCKSDPVIIDEDRLPSGTSAPNTVITERTVTALGLENELTPWGWLITAPAELTSNQIAAAEGAASKLGLSIETRNNEPTSAQVIGWATAIGIALALAILAMSVGLIRAETAADLRTLTATGATSWNRRAITSVTSGVLGFLGALLGTIAAYVAAIAFFRGRNMANHVGPSFANAPWRYLAVILVLMPLAAAAGGWLFSGREPPGVARQPVD
jgi:putative ABC transport system permease protein